MIKFDPRKDYYAVLGVNPTDERDTIRAKYWELARRLHTDVSGNTEANRTRFSEIAEAYAILSRDDSRAQYDKARKSKKKEQKKQVVVVVDPKQAKNLETITRATFAVKQLGIDYEDFFKAYDSFRFLQTYQREEAWYKKSRDNREPVTVGDIGRLEKMRKRAKSELKSVDSVAKRNYVEIVKLLGVLSKYNTAEKVASGYHIDIKELIWPPF